MLTIEENVERVKTLLDAKISKLLKIVYLLKEKPGVDKWELGMQEGQLLTMEFIRKELEADPDIRDAMLEKTLNRLESARLTD